MSLLTHDFSVDPPSMCTGKASPLVSTLSLEKNNFDFLLARTELSQISLTPALGKAFFQVQLWVPISPLAPCENILWPSGVRHLWVCEMS